MLYLAYGSNLSRSRMAERCPRATPLDPVILPDWRLCFERVATIQPAPGGTVPAALYRLTPACERTLDAVEGVAEGRYRRAHLTVADAKGRSRAVLTYIKVDARRGPPTEAYYAHIARGYADWGHDPAVLAAALADPGAERAP
ncbi:gamma-glutamylcyclotransferase family protein [Roseospira goensis]|uniref:Gamma-glutamylcyclotransferase (GGCT)/AIG2-like uncharacterized protein YtfP n=1 Tax=Roseospira goensis TaxID=391922 RepID=A0A7W6WKU9_9PROT|nr:gamma-glutamylcyclotransferase family protein [Roseospira goensis]MBB4286048.1 gamma-glutamylcyclotransferase (GGCT)/AIG2-like uncharacterized protein YtfP [Roseospira goensis]